MEFNIGGKILKLMELPGHTEGSTMLLDKENKTIYTGDAVNRNTWLFTNPTYKLERYIKNLELLAGRSGFEYIWCSHDTEKLPFAFVNYYVDFLKTTNFKNGKKISGKKSIETKLGEVLGISEKESEEIVIFEHKKTSSTYGDIAIYYSNYNI